MNTRYKISLFVLAAVLLMATACSSSATSATSSTTMAGFWLDENKMVTTIEAQGDGFIATRVDYTLASTVQTYMTSATYENGVLTWTYWAPTKPGITTMQSVSFNGDTLVVNWSNDRGGSGQMTLTRIDTPPYTADNSGHTFVPESAESAG